MALNGRAWADEADIVIVGLGIAGISAALEALATDPALDVLIVEKMPPSLAGGASRSAGNMLFLPTDLAGVIAYQRALNEPNPVPEDVLLAFSHGRLELEEWVARLVGEVGFALEIAPDAPAGVEYPDFPGASCFRFGTVPPVPHGLWRAFKAQLDRRPVRVQYESPAVDLVQEPETLEITGVRVRRGAQTALLGARRAVILCCGGYENNLQLHRDYFGVAEAYALSTPANTGDGLLMLQKAGAAMWHLRTPNQTGGFLPAVKVPEYEAAFFRDISFDGKSWIDVAKDNRRFWAEGRPAVFNHFRRLVHGHWVDSPLASVLPVHTIMDDACRREARFASARFGWNTAMLGYRWSEDNSAEVARGWILEAPTIAALATRIGRDPDALEATVRRFNEAAAAGHDPEFGRDPAKMRPISVAPFYAVPIVPAVVSTTGGGRRDAAARVLTPSGAPIPRLYEAGQLGSTQSNLYQGGTFLTEAMVFGRLAGRHAAQETPRA
jgi:glycine/D-amino acid oxidase-like deaminating enzyme